MERCRSRLPKPHGPVAAQLIDQQGRCGQSQARTSGASWPMPMCRSTPGMRSTSISSSLRVHVQGWPRRGSEQLAAGHPPAPEHAVLGVGQGFRWLYSSLTRRVTSARSKVNAWLMNALRIARNASRGRSRTGPMHNGSVSIWNWPLNPASCRLWAMSLPQRQWVRSTRRRNRDGAVQTEVA